MVDYWTIPYLSGHHTARDHVPHLPVRRKAMRPHPAILARYHITMHRRTELQE